MNNKTNNVNIGDYVDVDIENENKDKYDINYNILTGKIVNLDPLKIKKENKVINCSNKTVLDIHRRFVLTDEQENIVDRLYDIVDNIDIDINRIDIVSAQHVLKQSPREKIIEINNDISVYKSRLAYKRLAQYWINDYESTGKIFRLHNNLIDELSDTEMCDEDYKNWTYIEYPNSKQVKSYQKRNEVYFIDVN